ncbi:MAG: PilZ domain-containing protein [Desulfobacterales bacterium]
MDQNPENRDNARIEYKSPVAIENLKAGIIYQARMLNYSKYGLYFETDSLLPLGEEVFIGIEYSPFSDSQDMYECVRAKILWRRELPTSYFKYGYGVRFSVDYDKQRSQTSDLKIVEDQRKHQRKPYSKSIIYATKNHLIKALTKDISPAGVFIETENTLHAGQTITLAVPLKKAKTAKIKGQVIWSSRDGFGVKFLRIKK